ncbi:penicillin-binding protein 2 [Paenirhodobacter sp. CAU 1674]|jgi:cell division protein FtsI (penicillin-binding protein 3)|uniref:peptidoglycan D,D-transpeptidase FtsI family protein n=1 Tax=Paenirhodobacter sp. CAU 1674 TaxID=3032596 RepID=UPI0023DA0618|nr:penicillin-binding protein 2 [Paenirhodobacter sp. CAU 1674]MDF2140209.1 penicillin-binding protein 2 [Paenirhodobacter sp. CAU 1674]
MIRTPLRPLARILDARARGVNPDTIERENIRLRGEATRDRSRLVAEGRLLMMGLLFVGAFTTVGLRMGTLAASEPVEPQLSDTGAAIMAQRADITDRQGRVLATNLVTHALYAQPPMLIDPVNTAEKLVEIFPDLDRDRLVRDFTGTRKFLWIKKKISPEQMQAVHDIGDPGLLFGPREMRLYPNGALAAHVLGGARFGAEGVSSAEIVGVAGVEKAFDGWLRDPANAGAPLKLSIDLTIQSAMEEILSGGMKLMNAKGATAVLMEVQTGEIVAMASLPDFDPNDRPAPLTKGDAGDSPLFNRAVQGVYELGSTFKIFAVAQAMEMGLVNPGTMISTKTPLVYGRFRIRDFHNYGAENSVTDVIVHSSNVGTAHIAQMIGPERQREFLGKLGFLEPTPVELVEAPTGRPIIPQKWSEISAMTIGYGHGLSASPLHLAAAYATVANGGRKITPTLVHNADHAPGERVMSEVVARRTLAMMRAVVTRGTASFGDVKGYQVAGKTGTADKAKPTGGYYKDKVIATFAGTFPVTDPKYVLILTLDEPSENSGSEPRRTAGWTAVPVAAEVIRRVAPLLGLRPQADPETLEGIQLVKVKG